MTASATEATKRRPSRPSAIAVFIAVVALLAGLAGYAVRGDSHHGLPTHVYTGRLSVVSRPVNGSMDHTTIALDITSGKQGTGNGFTFAPGVVDNNARSLIGQRVTVYTTTLPGQGEVIVGLERQ